MNLHVTIVFAVIIAWNIAATNGGNYSYSLFMRIGN